MKTILILIAIYFLLRFLLRYFGPSIMRYFMNRMVKKAESKFYTAQNAPEQKEPGKTTIEYTPPNAYKAHKDVGEYIDYEEID